MTNITILHNPRCSKSRQTLQLLKDNGHEPKIIEYLKNPLSISELKLIQSQLGLENPIKMMRTKEPEFAELNLSVTDSPANSLLEAMSTCPKLLERPIVINNNQARIGRPPESVLEII